MYIIRKNTRRGIKDKQSAFAFISFLLVLSLFFLSTHFEAVYKRASRETISTILPGKEIKIAIFIKVFEQLQLNNAAAGYGAKTHSRHPPTPLSLHSLLGLSKKRAEHPCALIPLYQYFLQHIRLHAMIKKLHINLRYYHSALPI